MKKIFIPRKFKLGSFLVLGLSFLSVLSFILPSPAAEGVMELSRSFEWPSLMHPFGLDENGHDLFLQILHGSRVSLAVAFSVVAISLIIGLLVGTVSGLMGGVVDAILMRVVDIVYAFPNFLLALALMAVLGSSIQNLILVMCISTWATYARLIRGEVSYLKKKEFVMSAESLGVPTYRKVFFHIWPNLVPILSVQTMLTLVGVILAESGLSFLGIGIPPEIPTWGTLLQSGRQVLLEAPHISFFSGFCLFLLILGFHLLSEGLREILTPYKKIKEEG